MLTKYLSTPNANSESFESLLASAREGDPQAINTLCERYYPDVKSAVHRSLASDIRRGRPWLSARFSTGDVVQDVFRTVVKDIGAFGGTTESAFTGYLVMVVRNRLIDAIRFHEAEVRDGRIGTLELQEEYHAAEGPEPPGAAAANEELERFDRALSQLEERERLLVRARLEGVASFSELRERLGYPSVTATRRAFAAAQARLVVLMQKDSGVEEER